MFGPLFRVTVFLEVSVLQCSLLIILALPSPRCVSVLASVCTSSRCFSLLTCLSPCPSLDGVCGACCGSCLVRAQSTIVDLDVVAAGDGQLRSSLFSMICVHAGAVNSRYVFVLWGVVLRRGVLRSVGM